MVILVAVYDAVVMGVLGNAVVGGGKDDMVLKVVVMDLSQIYVLRDLVASMLIEGTSKAVERSYDAWLGLHLLHQVAKRLISSQPVGHIDDPRWFIQLWLNLYTSKAIEDTPIL
ncbi:hypothetical protein GUJ93_ZPchr0008g13841 [Zizania palustris]|uniref:Uncharacterized protein n=1 Tax=Zizania palustris TaxID=103762 RepID=A0A8J5V294_ZIZPA|nr:hypothetical protein GUJ93_ZPchr0008g13841 [Zizania palustris]